MLQWLGGVAGAITRHDFESNQVQMLYAFGYEPERLRDYTLRYAAEDAWLRSATPYQQTGRVLTGQEILSDSELVRSSFYQEWLKPQGLHHRLCGVLSRDRVTTLLIALMRPSSAPAFDSGAAQRLRGISAAPPAGARMAGSARDP